MRGTKIIIPKSLRKRVLDLSHEGHPGIVKIPKRKYGGQVWIKMSKCSVKHALIVS